jgi:Transcriptional regulator PadR-like family
MTQKKSEAGDLLRDTLDMLILKTLTGGEMHGYDIAEYIHERSDRVLGVEEGALYPALHRLEVRGLVAALRERDGSTSRALSVDAAISQCVRGMAEGARRCTEWYAIYWRRDIGRFCSILRLSTTSTAPALALW